MENEKNYEYWISKKLLIKSREIGFTYGDSKKFNDLDEICLREENLSLFGQLKLHKLIIYSGPGWKNCLGIIVGIQAVYYNMINGVKYVSSKRVGHEKIESDASFIIENNEFINKFEINYEKAIRSIAIYTDKGRSFFKGIKEGKLHTEDFTKNNNVILGFFGGYGASLHNLGIYSANLDLLHKLHKSQLTINEIYLKYEKFKIRATSRIDTITFDNQEEMSILNKSLLQLKIFKINFWRGKGFKKINGLTNGLQVFFKDLYSNNIYATSITCGRDDMDKNQPTTQFFFERENIEKIKIQDHGLIDNLTLITNLKEISVGGDGGENVTYINFLEKENSYIIGFFGGIGGNMHHIGKKQL